MKQTENQVQEQIQNHQRWERGRHLRWSPLSVPNHSIPARDEEGFELAGVAGRLTTCEQS